MSKGLTVRVGADPEVFVESTKLKMIVPICGLVGGTKDEPREFEGLNVKLDRRHGLFAYQEDGAAYEFNIPAAHSYEAVAMNLMTAWKASVKLLKTKDLLPVVAPYHEFKPELLTDPRTQVVGCSPDLDAYAKTDGAGQRLPLNIVDFGNTRFAGGHIHLSYDKSKVPAFAMARFLDVLLGLPSLIHDKQGVRRQYYGLPGLYREKSYGIEYRTLSNFWLKWIDNEDKTTLLYYVLGTVFDLGILAQNHPASLAQAYKNIPWDDVKDCITQENTKLAKEIWDYVDATAKIPTRYGKALWNAKVS